MEGHSQQVNEEANGQLRFNSNEHLEGQPVHEERIQSTTTDKISTIMGLDFKTSWKMFTQRGGVCNPLQ